MIRSLSARDCNERALSLDYVAHVEDTALGLVVAAFMLIPRRTSSFLNAPDSTIFILRTYEIAHNAVFGVDVFTVCDFLKGTVWIYRTVHGHRLVLVLPVLSDKESIAHVYGEVGAHLFRLPYFHVVVLKSQELCDGECAFDRGVELSAVASGQGEGLLHESDCVWLSAAVLVTNCVMNVC